MSESHSSEVLKMKLDSAAAIQTFVWIAVKHFDSRDQIGFVSR